MQTTSMKINKKKFRKLIKSPLLFFKDMIKKRMSPPYHLPYKTISKAKKVSGINTFSVITAVYNVELYLEDYFYSLVNQSLDFKQHIQLILVDDGSTDSSANIIKKWQEKYPENIIYVYKENGGQASARNVGLSYVTGSWIGFIDPDDFINTNYFQSIDAVASAPDSYIAALIATNVILYLEKESMFSDTHPLNYRFRSKRKTLIKNLGRDIPGSSTTAFFRRRLIEEASLRFQENISATFEDAHFMGSYLVAYSDMAVCYLPEAKYFYRKRSAKTSTLDATWTKNERFDEVLEFGCIDLLKNSQRQFGFVPTWIQWTVLYHLIWYFKKIINNESSVSFLDEQQKTTFKIHLTTIFQYIDEDIINKFNLVGYWFYHKVALLGYYKQITPKQQIIYIDEYDEYKQLLHIRYFYYGSIPNEQFIVDDLEVSPKFVKSRIHYFLGDILVYERIVLLKIKTSYNMSLEINLTKEQAMFSLGGHLHNKLSVNAIADFFHKKKRVISKGNFLSKSNIIRQLAKKNETNKKYSNLWLFIDRDTQADDNAEHLYRYVKKNHPEINSAFLLRKNSHDWKRLSKDGFNLIAFGSIEHQIALLNTKHLISSHADSYIVNFLDKKYFGDMLNYRFTFLQHGITRDDISSWLNSKNIDLLITSTNKEYHEITKEISTYKFTANNVISTGLARHDALLASQSSVEKIILIMPTWRGNIVGKCTSQSASRTKDDRFFNSLYYISWQNLLQSKKLKDLCTTYNYKVIFFPHINMQIYMDDFKLPEWIEARTHATDPVLQDLFKKTSVLITDYSSVFFELGLIQRSVIYYQFDYKEFYFGESAHPSKPGYFNFNEDGFGPVCQTENGVLYELENILKNNGELDEIYLKRIRETFAYRDGQNCKRIIEAIHKINIPAE